MEYSLSDLTGKVAVIIGASGQHNFGVAIARRMAKADARVVVSARRQEPITALAAEIGGVAIACDISSEDQLKNLFGQVEEQMGRVDIAVNCAGQQSAAPISMFGGRFGHKATKLPVKTVRRIYELSGVLVFQCMTSASGQ